MEFTKSEIDKEYQASENNDGDFGTTISEPDSTLTPKIIAPKTTSPRILNVDLLRGIALLGILSMNIVSFAMPFPAYRNPHAFMGDSAFNHLLFGLTHIFADQKCMGLFSLLFGTSVMLFISKLKSSGRGVKRYYYSRTLWLLLFGFLHGLFLWEGDILFYYAFLGLFIYWFWRLFPSIQFGLGIAIFLLAIYFDSMGQEYINSLSAAEINYLSYLWLPSDSYINLDTLSHLGPYRDMVDFRWRTNFNFFDSSVGELSINMLGQGLSRALGMMLIGMAFFKWGIVTGEKSFRFYLNLTFVGLGIGLPLSSFGLWQFYLHDWDFSYGFFDGLVYNHIATLFTVFGYIGFWSMLHMLGVFIWLQKGLCAVGRMAFTNYLCQSLICTTLFYGYGYGFGWFGQLDRAHALLVVVLIWIFQIIFSLLWMSIFNYGPLEWVWRLLTYFKPTPLLKKY
ncbi:DUF418 domain-containing protein [Aurantivibrio infirmus]